jgi:predicted Zn finger-like uncharacterized protein
VNFSCGNCGRAYVVADDKVRGRSFKVKCRACGHLIVVKASGVQTAPDSAAPAPDLAATVARPPEEAAPATTPSAATTELVARPPPRPPFAAPPPPPEPPGTRSEYEPSDPDPQTERSEVVSEDWFSANAAPAADDGWLADPPQAPANTPAAEPNVPPPASRKRGLVLALTALSVVAIGAAVAFHFGLLGKSRSAPARPVAVAPEPKPVAPEPKPAAPVPAPAPAVDLPSVPPDPPKARVGTDALLAGGNVQPDAAGAGADKPPVKSPPAIDQAPAPIQAPAKVRTSRGPSFEPERRGKAGRGDSLRIRRIGSKDKKLLDLMAKKADTAPTAPVEKLDLDTAAPALDEAQVARTVAENRKAFDACISRSLRHGSSLQLAGRKVIATFTIRPDGSVIDPALDDAQIDSNDLGACLKAVCRRLAFPAFGGAPIEVAVPLALSRVE